MPDYKVIFTQIFEIKSRNEGEVEEKFDEALEDLNMEDFNLRDVYYEVSEDIEPRRRRRQVELREAPKPRPREGHQRDRDEDISYFEKLSKHFWG